MQRVAVIGNPGAWSTERLADALAERTGYRRVVDPAQVVLDLERCEVTDGDLSLGELDAIVIKKLGSEYSPRHLDRLEVLRYLSERGTPVFSDPLKIMRVIDRLSCTVTLRLHDIPMPPTVITEGREEALRAVRRFGRAVFKPLFSTKARGMEIIEDGPGAEEAIRAYQDGGQSVLYIQQAMDLPGRDLGITFLGGEYIGTYARVGHAGSWNTTHREGGRYQAHDPAPELIDLARRAQAPFGLDFTSVDVAETTSGPVVWEVSAFGGFRGLTEGNGLDVAGMLASFVLGRLERK